MHTSLSLTHYLSRQYNNFDLIRIILAFIVIVHHASPIAQVPVSIFHENPLGINAGNSAVAFFFFLSGLVVTNSLLKKHSAIHYFTARIFRIWPALTFVLICTAFIIGPLVTELSLKEYFSQSAVYDYVRVNLSLGSKHYLPGVFENNTTTSAVNGSLWTINWEIKCYLYLFFLLYICSFNRKSAKALLLLGFISILFLGIIDTPLFGKKLYAKPYVMLFMSAAFMSVMQNKIYINRYTWLFSICFFIGTIYLNAEEFIRFLALSLFLMHVAFWSPFVRIKPKYDISFGVYISAFPIAQTIEYYLTDISYIMHIVLVTLVSFTFGTLSWIYIEAPYIKKGQRTATYLIERYSQVKLNIKKQFNL